MLVGVGAVGQRPEEERAILEIVTEMGGEGRERIRRSGHYGMYFRKASVALVPPKPKALLSATSTSCLRAWLGM